MSGTVRRLLAVRALRSFTQGSLNVAVPLYLLGRGVSAAGLGLLFTASFVVGALLTVPVGLGADRYGRKPFMIAFTVLMLIWGATYTATGYVPLLLAVSALAGIGRGGGGMAAGQAGPFGPAEQAWLADVVPAAHRRRVFTANGVLASLAGAAGALAAGGPALAHRLGADGWIGDDRLLFVLTAAAAVASLVLLRPIPDPVRWSRAASRVSGADVLAAVAGPRLSRRSVRLVGRQAVVGATNAFGVASVNSLFVVWLRLRFDENVGSIGVVFALSYLLSAASIVAAGRLARYAGSVRTIVAARLLAAALMIGTALAPTFTVAVAFQIARTAATGMVVPVRQAFTMGLFPASERGAAAGVTGVVRRLGGAASPPVSGALLDAGQLEAPFFLGAAFQILSALLYEALFRSLDTAGASSSITTRS